MLKNGDMKFQVLMIAFDGMTDLDFAAPFDAFSRMPDTSVTRASLSGGPVISDLGPKVDADTQLDAVISTDLLFVGGGPGANAMMEDDAMLTHLRRLSKDASWITSVCTGALVLGAAGLLRGYNAATHWSAMDALVPLGANPVHQRVVVDRNRITGGGVTAGIDFALLVADILHGPLVAKCLQLGMEYAPQPPYDSGTPDTAEPEVSSLMSQRLAPSTTKRVAAAKRASQRWP